ncbi:UNVERIFIED_CONTAM: hypothetical protein FKN15_075727 [Acipenser sinensis]
MIPAPPQRVHGAQRPRVGTERLAKFSLAPPQQAHGPQLPRAGSRGSPMVPGTSPAHTGPSDSARGPNCSQMVRHLPSALTGPSDPARGPIGSPNGPLHLPCACTGPSYQAWSPSGSPICPWHLPSKRTGQRFRTGSQRLAKWVLAYPPQAHRLQRHRSQRRANGPLHIPSAHTGTSDLARGQSGLPNGPWYLPIVRTGAQRPRAESQLLDKWSLAPTQHAHGPQSLHVGFQRLAK